MGKDRSILQKWEQCNSENEMDDGRERVSEEATPGTLSIGEEIFGNRNTLFKKGIGSSGGSLVDSVMTCLSSHQTAHFLNELFSKKVRGYLPENARFPKSTGAPALVLFKQQTRAGPGLQRAGRSGASRRSFPGPECGSRCGAAYCLRGRGGARRGSRGHSAIGACVPGRAGSRFCAWLFWGGPVSPFVWGPSAAACPGWSSWTNWSCSWKRVSGRRRRRRRQSCERSGRAWEEREI